MRRKWDHPAPLTMNIAFDPQLLNTLADEHPTRPNPRSISLINTRRTVSLKLFKPSTMETTIPSTFMPSSLKSSKRRAFSKDIHSLRSENMRMQNMLNKNEMALLRRAGATEQISRRVVKDLENEGTKQMIVSIRKNLLSTSIRSFQEQQIESTYKNIMKKLRRIPQ